MPRGCLDGFDEEYSFRQTEDALNSLEASQEAFKEGEDEEQVDKGSGLTYFNHHHS